MAVQDQNLDQFLGLRNTLRPNRQPFGALSEAIDVVIDDNGGIQTRDGYSLRKSHTAIKSAYANPKGDKLFILDNGSLIARHLDGTEVTLATLGDSYLNWAEFEDKIFLAGDQSIAVVEGRYKFYDLQFPAPGQPVVTIIDGSLSSGQYQVATVLRDAVTGREGTASVVAVVDVINTGALSIDVGPNVAGYEYDVYVSPPDSEYLYLVASVPSGVAVFGNLFEHYARELDPRQINSSTPPKDISAIAAHDAQLFVAQYDQPSDTSYVFWSEPYWYWMFKKYQNFVAIPNEITGMQSVADGVLIATNRAIWLLSDDDALRQLADYGAPKGIPIAVDSDGNTVVWTNKGLGAYAGGQFENLYESKLSVPPGSQCFVSIIDHDGSKEAVVIVDQGGTAFNPYS